MEQTVVNSPSRKMAARPSFLAIGILSLRSIGMGIMDTATSEIMVTTA